MASRLKLLFTLAVPIARSLARSRFVVEAVEPRCLLSAIILGDASSSNQWRVQSDSNDPSKVQFLVDGGSPRLLEERARSEVHSVSLSADSGDTSFTIDFSHGVPLNSTFLNLGGAGSLILAGVQATNVRIVQSATDGAGSITAWGSVIKYVGAKSITANAFHRVTFVAPEGSQNLSVINGGGDVVHVSGRSGDTIVTPVYTHDIHKLVVDSSANHGKGRDRAESVDVTIAGQPQPNELKVLKLKLGGGQNTIVDGASRATLETHLPRAATLDAEVDFNSTLNLLGRQRFSALKLYDTSTLRLVGGKGQIVRMDHFFHAPGTLQDVGKGRVLLSANASPMDVVDDVEIDGVQTFGSEDEWYVPPPWIQVWWKDLTTTACYNRYLVQHVIMTDPSSNSGKSQGNDEYWEAWEIDHNGKVGDHGEFELTSDTMQPTDASDLNVIGNYSVEGWAYIYNDTENQPNLFPDDDDSNSGGLPTRRTAPPGGSDLGAYHHGVFEYWSEVDDVNFCY